MCSLPHFGDAASLLVAMLHFSGNVTADLLDIASSLLLKLLVELGNEGIGAMFGGEEVSELAQGHEGLKRSGIQEEAGENGAL